MKYPLLQLALDFIDLPRAIKVAKEAVHSGMVDLIEIGTPLIKSEGVRAITEIKSILKSEFKESQLYNIKFVADMKTMDVGRTEVEIAAKAGADIVCILGVAHDETLKESIQAAKNYGCEIMVDMLAVENVLERIKVIQEFGPDYFGFHIPIDQQMRGEINFDFVSQIKKITNVPIAVAGGINSETAVDAVNAGADIIIVGGAITKSKDVTKSIQEIKQAMLTKTKIESVLYTRAKNVEEIKKILSMVSTANISDALHRGLPLYGLMPIGENIKIVGPAVTVRTYPGDWAKPVEAIDIAEKDSVIVIDAGGVPPAVWGELATNSAIQKGLSGVIIWGAIRDVSEIKKLKFPAFAKIVTPQAGEPKGFGEINVPITISGIKIFPQDYIVADDDGIVVIPKEKLVEITNRAMDVLEKENRIREEILQGSTLSKVQDLLRWEKK